jgi:dTDP-4-dehydrorhamnose reductase
MRVLITGAGGQLGQDLVATFLPTHEVVAATRTELDLAERDSVMSAVCSVEPDVIVHPGAWTAVDACEADPARAFTVNALGTRHVATAARTVGAHVCYVSTDYVFDGHSPEPYNEWSATNPLSVYGASKLAGEREIGAICPGATVVRTSSIVSSHGRNFLTTMLRLVQERDEIGVVDDQHCCPTFAQDLAPLIRRLAIGRFAGVYHATNQGATTWFEFAQAVLAAAGHDPAKIRPISTAAYGAPAPRPRNSVLDNLALRASDLPLLPRWQDSLDDTVRAAMTLDPSRNQHEPAKELA